MKGKELWSTEGVPRVCLPAGLPGMECVSREEDEGGVGDVLSYNRVRRDVEVVVVEVEVEVEVKEDQRYKIGRINNSERLRDSMFINNYKKCCLW